MQRDIPKDLPDLYNLEKIEDKPPWYYYKILLSKIKTIDCQTVLGKRTRY